MSKNEKEITELAKKVNAKRAELNAARKNKVPNTEQLKGELKELIKQQLSKYKEHIKQYFKSK